MQYYIDTAIFRDFYENRKDSTKPLGEFAFQFFKYCGNEKSLVLYSYVVIRELSGSYSKDQITKLIDTVKGLCKIKEIEINEIQIEEANILKSKLKIPYGDILHAILARDNNAILITTDKHFKELTKIIIAKTPEEIIYG